MKMLDHLLDLTLDSHTEEQSGSTGMQSDLEDPYCRREAVGRINETYRIFNLGFFLAGCVLILFSLIWWFMNRKKHFLVIRSHAVAVLTGFGYFVFLISQPLARWTMDQQNFLNRCSVTSMFFSAGCFLLYSCAMLRFVSSYYKSRLVERIVKIYLPSDERNHQPVPNTDLTDTASPYSPRTNQSFVSSLSLPTLKYLNKAVQKEMYRSSQRFFWSLSPILGLASVLLSFPLVAILCPEFGIVKCNLSQSMTIAAIFTSTFLLFSLYSLWKMKKKLAEHPDPFGLQREMLCGALLIVLVLPVLSLGFILSEATLSPTEVLVWDYTAFADIGMTILFVYSVPYQVYIARQYPNSHFELKLADILNHPTCRNLFQQHLSSELSVSNLNFWMAVQGWKLFYRNTRRKAREEQAKVIFDSFFSYESDTELNVGYFQRNNLEKMIMSQAEYPITLFDEVESEIYKLMESDSFFRFKITGLYRFYMGFDSKLSFSPGVPSI